MQIFCIQISLMVELLLPMSKKSWWIKWNCIKCEVWLYFRCGMAKEGTSRTVRIERIRFTIFYLYIVTQKSQETLPIDTSRPHAPSNLHRTTHLGHEYNNSISNKYHAIHTLCSSSPYNTNQEKITEIHLCCCNFCVFLACVPSGNQFIDLRQSICSSGQHHNIFCPLRFYTWTAGAHTQTWKTNISSWMTWVICLSQIYGLFKCYWHWFCHLSNRLRLWSPGRVCDSLWPHRNRMVYVCNNRVSEYFWIIIGIFDLRCFLIARSTASVNHAVTHGKQLIGHKFIYIPISSEFINHKRSQMTRRDRIIAF